MSFSSKVKEELSSHISNTVHCRVAELAAMISMCGSVMIDDKNNYAIRVRTETEPTAKKIHTLLWKTFHIDTEITIRDNAYSRI